MHHVVIGVTNHVFDEEQKRDSGRQLANEEVLPDWPSGCKGRNLCKTGDG